MPESFLNCVNNGGRVRTKKLKDGKYMHVCFMGGKSYAGEIKTKEELEFQDTENEYVKQDGKWNKVGENKMDKTFQESISFSFKEMKIDEEKRTVKVCALAPCISKNNRYYSPKVVESIKGTLVGKKSYADHDTRDTKNVVGKIVDEEFQDGRVYAHIKFSKATGIAKETFEKIADGTLTDVSIAADGRTRRIKLGEREVDEVYNLEVRSVDFVTEGGVAEAKVMQVWENVNDIPKISEVKEMEIKTVEELRAAYPELVLEVEKPLKEELTTLKTAKEVADQKLIEKELAEFKEAEIVKLEANDKIKATLREKVNGKTKEDISASIKSEFDYIKKVSEALKEKAETHGIPPAGTKTKEGQPVEWTSQMIREDSRIPEAMKGNAIELLWNQGSKAVVEFLKTQNIEID